MTSETAPQSNRRHWEDQYVQGTTPWDTRITPPEVEAFWESQRLPTCGVALDLGCGTGTNLQYLADLGIVAVGFEHAGNALREGQRRQRQDRPDLVARVHFVQADVTRLPVIGAQAVYILDIGCLHGLHPDSRRAYARGVIDNLAPGGYYHLYAFDRVEPEPGQSPERAWRGLEEGECERLFGPQLEIVEMIQAEPQRQPCRWYLLRKICIGQ